MTPHRKKRGRFYEPCAREREGAFISLPEAFHDFANGLDSRKRSLDDVLAELQRMEENIPGVRITVVPPQEGYIQIAYRDKGFRLVRPLIKYR